MNWRRGRAAILSALISFVLPAIPADAQQVVTIGDVGGSGGIRLEFWDSQSGPTQDGTFRWFTDDAELRATGTWRESEIDAVTRGARYWWEILGENNTPARDLTFLISRNAGFVEPDGSISELTTSSESPEVQVGGIRSSVTNHVLAFGVNVASPFQADNLINFQDLDGFPFSDRPGGPLDNGGGVNMEAVMIHEIAHALGVITSAPYGIVGDNAVGIPPEGMLRLFETQIIDADGNPVVVGESYLPATPYFFNGVQSTSVFGRPVPLNQMTIEKGHLGVDPLLFSHQPFRNYIFMTEVELALLQDMGYQINRQEHFGRSYYQNGSGHEEINTTGFDSSKTYGVGVHIFSHDHRLVQAADLTASGYGATGIRVDGVNNIVTINPDVTITTNGDYGTGVLVSNGAGNSIIHRGTIIASSATEEATGTGILIDFGANLLSGASRTSSTPVDYRQDGTPMTGYLVDYLDITGTISAPFGNAIRVGTSAAVQSINIMRDAVIDGKISISSLYSTSAGLLPTQLNFGLAADEFGRHTAESDLSFELALNGAVDTNGEINILGGKDSNRGVQFQGSVQARQVNVSSSGRVEFSNELIVNNIENHGHFTLLEGAEMPLTQYLNNYGEFVLQDSTVTLYIEFRNHGHFHSDGGTINTGFGRTNRQVTFETGSSYTGINDTIQVSRGRIDLFGTANSRDGDWSARDEIAIHAGGRLSGTPTLRAARVINYTGGAIAPGNSIGQINIDGEFVNDGDLEIELTTALTPLDSDRIVVTNGPAWINTDSFATRGTFRFTGDVDASPEDYAIGRRYTLIQTDGPDQLLVGYRPIAEDDIDGRRFILRSDADRSRLYTGGAQDYYAFVGRDVPYTEIAQTGNELAVARYLDAIKTWDDNSDQANQIQWIRDTLDLIPDEADVRDAFRMISGELYGSLTPMILQQMHSSSFRTAASARTNSDLCTKSVTVADRDGLYGTIIGFGTGGHVQGDGNASGYSFGAGGTQVQVGYGQSDTLVGGYYNFTNGSFDGAGAAGIEIHDFGGFLLRKEAWSHFLLSAGGGTASTHLNRTVVFGNTDLQDPIADRFSSSSTAGVMSAYGEFGLDAEFDGFAVRPFTGLSYAYVSSSGIDEGTALLALDGRINSQHSLRSMLGADLSLCVPGQQNLVWDLRAMWMHEFQKQKAGRATYDFDGERVQISGVGLGSDFAVIGTTLSREFLNGRSRLFASYDLIANRHQTLNTGSGGLEFLW